MFDIGGGELILIVIAILVLFGPKKLPEIAEYVGKGMREVRKAQSQFREQFDNIKREVDAADSDKKPIKSVPANDLSALYDAPAGPPEQERDLSSQQYGFTPVDPDRKNDKPASEMKIDAAESDQSKPDAPDEDNSAKANSV